jgi:hypothetical protein
LVKILKFFDVNADPDPRYGNLFGPESEIRDGKNSDSGSGINIPDPQHWLEITQLGFNICSADVATPFILLSNVFMITCPDYDNSNYPLFNSFS